MGVKVVVEAHGMDCGRFEFVTQAEADAYAAGYKKAVAMWNGDGCVLMLTRWARMGDCERAILSLYAGTPESPR